MREMLSEVYFTCIKSLSLARPHTQRPHTHREVSGQRVTRCSPDVNKYHHHHHHNRDYLWIESKPASEDWPSGWENVLLEAKRN
jgi:hypothetical protein